MPIFDFSFTVAAPLTAVAAFHSDTKVLKKLTPPPLWIQIHRFDPLGEGARADFTLWLVFLPLPWTAIHSGVSQNGFTDTQAKGPLKKWQHTHRFTAVQPDLTRIQEHIAYEHQPGWRGFLTRLLFNTPGLYALFTARKLLTRWYVLHTLT